MIRFTVEEIAEILDYSIIVVDDLGLSCDECDAKITEYINAKLEAKQVEEDNKSLRRTL